MGRFAEEAAQLVAAYRACARLDPLREMLATPADRFSISPAAVEADDAPVFAAFDELRPLAQQTVEWFQAVAAQAREHEAEVGEDEASLRAALTEIEAVCGPARDLAAEAVPALDVGQRAALARHLVVDQHLYDQLWGPTGKPRDDPTPAGILDDFVDHALDQFLARSQRIQPSEVWFQALTLFLGPKWAKGPIPWRPIRRKYPRLRRWRDLQQPMQTIENYGQWLAGAYERVRHAYDQAVAERRRAEDEQRRQEQAVEERRRADDARQVATRARTLRDEFASHVRSCLLSSQQLRDRDWGLPLLRRLTFPDGVLDAAGETVVAPSLSKDQAHDVLAVVDIAFQHGEAAGERLSELVATEDRLLEERGRLHDAAADLPVDSRVYTDLASLHPHLRRAYDWFVQHMDAVIPIVAEHAPDKASALHRAVIDVQRTEQ